MVGYPERRGDVVWRNSAGRGGLSPHLDSGGAQMSDSRCVRFSSSAALSAPVGGGTSTGNFELCAISTAEESESGLQPVGSPANWRCIAVEKLSGVELLDGSWRTAPNHSRPASCIADADVDADDYPERNPQKGH